MLRVWLSSSSLIHTEALSSLITSFGYEVTNLSDASPQVAVWSLDTQPFPKPLPSLPTLAIVTFTEDAKLVELLELGYRGYHLPDKPSAQLKRAIYTVYEGEVWAERRIVAQALTPTLAPILTPRQDQVMSLLKLGQSNKQIAAQLGVAEKTVKAHVSAILEKFGAKNRVSLLLNSPPHQPERH
jgi:DNA-binding NarL/FixJ family response regulator